MEGRYARYASAYLRRTVSPRTPVATFHRPLDSGRWLGRGLVVLAIVNCLTGLMNLDPGSNYVIAFIVLICVVGIVAIVRSLMVLIVRGLLFCCVLGDGHQVS